MSDRLTFDAASHTYYLDGMGVPSVTQILRAMGLIDFSGVPDYYLLAARDRGSKVHRMLHYYDDGDLDEGGLDPALAPYLTAYRRFRADSGFTPDLIEHPVYSETWKYAGTLDRTGQMNGRPTLIDFKSGGLDKWVALQTAAYADCLEGCYVRCGLQLRRDGTYRLHQFSDHKDRQIWMAAVALYHWRRS